MGRCAAKNVGKVSKKGLILVLTLILTLILTLTLTLTLNVGKVIIQGAHQSP